MLIVWQPPGAAARDLVGRKLFDASRTSTAHDLQL
jgi:hypothetical protein